MSYARIAVLLLGAVLLAAACQPGAASADWKTPPNKDAAKTQVDAGFQTYGMPDSWANYGASITAFCQKNWTFDCLPKRTDTDMSSAEEIQRFDGEKNNPIAVMADIGIQFGPVAETIGVVPEYLPPNASGLPEGFKSKTGGWVGTFVGVPGFVVNTDVMEDKGIPVPRTWADLTKPEYKGLVGIGQVGKSGTATTSFIAMTMAAGGSIDDFGPGVTFAKSLLANIEGVKEGAAEDLEKGEIPIQIKYDFNLLAAAEAVKEKGVNAEVVIPSDGSLYAASALMVNKYNTGKMDFAKMFMEWVLTDEGQTVFAEFGARPVRYVLGDLQLPDTAKAKWLPDDMYANVQQVDITKVTIDQIAEIWNGQVLGQ